MESNNWEIVERPSYLGKKRSQKYAEWDALYGPENWHLGWKINENFVDFLGVCALYEDGYYEFLRENPEFLYQLVDEASNVYDDSPSNVGSYLDYKNQETERTHIQDIAIRRSLVRMGLWFKGTKLIQIRHSQGNHPLSMILSPGKVPFHKPKLIVQPELVGWWDKESIESFYQSNKFLLRKIG